jgi:tripartite-type tricarboxylate transporter receptor subunit TctC
MVNEVRAYGAVMRTTVTALVCIAGAILAPPQASALDYPTRTVHVIVPFTAGGAPDVLMRLLGQKLAEKWGQGVVIENRAGGNTLIGTVAGAKSAPDGYTLTLAADQTFVLNPLLYSSLPYSMKEFDPIILMASIPHMLAVANKVPVTNVKELIALAKAKPDTITFGTTGPGTIQRIATEYFAGIAGVKLVHVPYKGANETTTAILAGEIDMTINGMSNILPHIGEGKLKALAVSTVTRNPLAPDVPTMQEAGVPGYSSQGAFGLFAPAGTPKDIIDKLNGEIVAMLKTPEVQARITREGAIPIGSTPEQWSARFKNEVDKWAKVARSAGLATAN